VFILFAGVRGVVEVCVLFTEKNTQRFCSRANLSPFTANNINNLLVFSRFNMAEARLGVAFQFQVTDEGRIFVNIDRNALKFVGRAMMKSAKRRVKGAKKAILKRSFPATPATWILLVAALSAARYTEHETTVGVLGKLERGMPW